MLGWRGFALLIDSHYMRTCQTWTMFCCFPELRSEGNCSPAVTAKARRYSFFLRYKASICNEKTQHEKGTIALNKSLTPESTPPSAVIIPGLTYIYLCWPSGSYIHIPRIGIWSGVYLKVTVRIKFYGARLQFICRVCQS